MTTLTWTGVLNGATGTNFNSSSFWSGAVAYKSGIGLDLVVDSTATGTVIIDNGSASHNSLSINNGSVAFSLSTGRTLTLASSAASGLTLTAGSFTMGGTTASGLIANALNLNGAAAVMTVGQLAVVTVAKNFTLSAGSLSLTTLGALNLGTATGSAAGQAQINGTNVATISGGTLAATTFNMSAGTLTQSGGTITNTGTATFSGGTITNSGSAVFKASAVHLNTAMTINGGTILSTTTAGISVASGTVITMGGGTLDATNAGGVPTGTIANAGTLTGTGVLMGNINGTGSIVATGGTLDIANNVAASTNTLSVATASVLKLDGNVGANVNLGAATTSGVLEFGNATALMNFTGTIANLDIGASAASVSGFEFLNLQGVTVRQAKIGGVATHTFNGSANTVSLYSDAAGTALIGTINLAAAPTNGTFLDWGADSSVDGNAFGGGTDVFLSSVVCYADGTAIETPDGAVPVESLAAGDMVVTLQDGKAEPMPVKWMGVRTIDIANHPQPQTVAPVRIRAGAFGDDLPRRDLLVSPAHAIYIDGKLVPANLLINHMTIVQDLHARSVTYRHVELDRHALILAEGLTSESYLDTGNRAYFTNAGLATILHPEFHVNAGLKTWERDACAPLAIDAEIVAPIWQELANRAKMLGYVAPEFTTTQDADLYLEADGRRLRPIAVSQGRHTFMLPAGANAIVLKSRASAPADLDPRTGDWRPLGVAVRGMTLRTGDHHITIPADHPGLVEGWHTAETGNGSVWRWTAGAAAIPMTGTAGPAMLDIDIDAMGTYILARSDRQTQALAA